MGKMLMTTLLFSAIIATAAAEVFNLGFPGHNSRELLARFDHDVAPRRPDLVILLAGTNDFLNSFNSQTLEQYTANMNGIIDKCQALHAKVILVNLPPCIECYLLKRHPRKFYGNDTPNEKVAKANRRLQQIAAKRKIPLVDFNAVVRRYPLNNAPESLLKNPANSQDEDGVHPTVAGYRMLAEAVFKTIKAERIRAERILCYGDSITNGVHVQGAGTADIHAETYPGNLTRMLAETTDAQTPDRAK